MADEDATRLIISTDAANEADDQFAIAHALLTPELDVEGIVPTHFGAHRGPDTLSDSRREVDRLLRYLGTGGAVRVADGAPHALPNEHAAVPSDGARLIIEAARRQDARPLYVACLGPLTDIASALLLEPDIAERNLRVVWLGGGAWPEGHPEFNLANDPAAANALLGSRLEVWQLPFTIYQRMEVSFDELDSRVAPCGELGRALAGRVHEVARVAGEAEGRRRRSWCIGDDAVIGVILKPERGRWSMRPAPRVTADLRYDHGRGARDIRVYTDIDSRFVLEDLFAKLSRTFRPPSDSS